MNEQAPEREGQGVERLGWRQRFAWGYQAGDKGGEIVGLLAC